MEKDNSKPILKFEPGSRQPFMLYLISVTIVSAVIVIVCLFTSGLSFSQEEDELILGDVNLNGAVDSADVLILSQFLTGNTLLNEEQLVLADVDKNGEINAKDSMLIIQHLGYSPDTLSEEITQQQSEEQTDSQGDEITQAPTRDESEVQESPQSTTNPAEADFDRYGKAENMAFLTGENGVYYTARIVNSWQSAEGKYMYQIEFVVKNNSEKSIYNTSAEIVLSQVCEVVKDWDCKTNTENETIKVTTQNEGRILAGGTFNCGFVISAGSPITIESVNK